MTGADLSRLLPDALTRLADSKDELRDLDAAIGDGDLGITVSQGSIAARDAIVALPEGATPAEVLRAMGPAVARANPSSFAALVAAALLAASRALGDGQSVTPADMLAAARVGADTISARGKADLGDKTILDALIPSLEAAEGNPDGPFDAALEAARAGVDSTRDMVSKRGRAAWMGERTRGHVDPGAMAYLRLLEAIEATNTDA